MGARIVPVGGAATRPPVSVWICRVRSSTTSISTRSPTTPSAHRPTPPSSAWAATVHDCPSRSRWYRGVPGTATRCASSASPPTSTRVPSTSTSTVWAPMRTKYFTAPPACVSSRRLQDRHGLHLRRLRKQIERPHRHQPVVHAQPVQVARERRSEEHTSELQSLAYLVCRLLLEKKKNTHYDMC